MGVLLIALLGFALLDALDVLLVAITTAVVADSRLTRRSPMVGGLSFLGGVFAVSVAFGVATVLGIDFLVRLFDFQLTPMLRYWGELLIGVVLIGVAALPMDTTMRGGGRWVEPVRRYPWLMGVFGFTLGLAKVPTSVPYLAALALLSAQRPLPVVWPLIVAGYCAIALLLPLVVLALAMRRTPRARKVYRVLVRGLTRFGPPVVRVLFVVFGVVLVVDALVHARQLW
ncbi:GAP family protein [Nocardia neocaledoniensis]|uniref:GAP family protein n=1 Tax=Nocardia neocaledoniensis TaxID=236511 RepID=UPI002455D26D|nr:GAP family protein [Nocardia neocaledoniensis]